MPSALKKVNVVSFVLVALFSMSSWMNIVGMWVELPIMVDALPEGWNLPFYMTLIIQLANVGPAIYTIYNKCKKRRQSHNNEVLFCIIIMSTSIISCILTSIFWNYTVFINDHFSSLPVFLLLSFSSLASCTSTLIFLPFMSRFISQYMYAYYFGQGLSGLVPGVLGLFQGLGGNPTCINISNITTVSAKSNYSNDSVPHLKPIFPKPNFSVMVFFLILSVFLITSLLAFIFLNVSKRWLVDAENSNNVLVVDEQTNNATSEKNEDFTDDHDKKLIDNKNSISQSSSSSSHPPSPQTNRLVLFFYLIIVLVLNMSINSIIPATQSYTCLSYGNTVYTLTVRLSSLFNSIFSLLSMFIPKPSFTVLTVLTTTALSILTFHLVIASLSPNPPFIESIYGPILIVSSCFK